MISSSDGASATKAIEVWPKEEGSWGGTWIKGMGVSKREPEDSGQSREEVGECHDPCHCWWLRR